MVPGIDIAFANWYICILFSGEREGRNITRGVDNGAFQVRCRTLQGEYAKLAQCVTTTFVRTLVATRLY